MCLLLFLLPFLLGGCRQDSEPLKIGFAGELTGDNRSPSIKVFQGVQLAVEQQNAEGGVRGRRVELVSRDDGGDPARVPEVDRGLVEAGVEAIIGHPTSTTSMAALELINSSRTVMISPTATADALFGRDDYFFTFLASNAELAARIALFARKELELATVTAVYDRANLEYTGNYYRRFRDAFSRRQGEVTDVRSFDSTTVTDFSGIVEKLLAPTPDGLLILASSTETASFLQQLYKRSAALPVLSCDWASNRDLIQLGGPYTSRVYIAETLHYNAGKEAYRGFADRFQERYGEEPSIGAAKGYEAAGVILQALERREKGESLKEVMLEHSFSGFEQELDFDRHGDVQRRLCIKTIRGRHFAVVR